MRGFCSIVLGLLACDCDVHTCTLMDCNGAPSKVALVDDSGGSVAAKGEYRSSGRNHDVSATAFDCNDARSPAHCEDGVLLLNAPGGHDSKDEIRFELANGEFTDWQPVALTITEHTDSDFNGPGCSCTWYTAVVEPVVVPSEARP